MMNSTGRQMLQRMGQWQTKRKAKKERETLTCKGKEKGEKENGRWRRGHEEENMSKGIE